ncbi:MAG: hypothetical protein Q8M18_11015 [Bradyrhizobium sp.]|nr:hypothetical protein [Bradyrhizobium sp.]
MTARFDRAFAKASRASLLLALSASQPASAAPATPEQCRARKPDASRPLSRRNPQRPRHNQPPAPEEASLSEA